MQLRSKLGLTSSLCVALGGVVLWFGGCEQVSDTGSSAASDSANASTNTSASTGATTSSGTGASTGSSTSSGTPNCMPETPTSFPYQPACCDYQVAGHEVTESGFDDGKIGASAKPDHVHASFAGSSATSFAINWRTGDDTTASQLLYGSDEALVKAADAAGDKVTLVKGHHYLYASLLDSANPTRVHEAHVCGLSASTSYYYKVGGPGAWSDVYSIATAPAVGSSEPIRFAVLGDSRNDPTTFAKIEEAIAALAPDLQIFTGDAVATGVIQKDWDAWFEASTGKFAVQTLLAKVPFMPVNGNHENLAVNYVAQFALPQHLAENEKAQGEEYYSFDYGNAHFVALNDTPESGAVTGPQLEWLEADLAAVDRNKTPWVFAMHHRSLYSCGGSHGSDIQLRKAWQPIFDQYQVDVVFSGHDHLYERSKPIRGLAGDDGKLAQAGANDTPVNGSGTLYLVSGGAGAPLYNADSSCDHTHITEKTRNYVIVDLDDKKLSAKAYRLDGSLLEEFSFTK
jgi:3',5'-cyclic AMP phosphodiesterase CpdA